MALKYSISDLFKLLHYIWKDTLRATDSVEGVDPEISSRKVQTYVHHLNISILHLSWLHVLFSIKLYN